MIIRLHHDKDVLPVLVNLTGGPAGVTLQRHTESIGGRETLRFTYTCFGLSGSPAAEFLQREEPLAWALSALMKSELPPERHAAKCRQRLAAADLPAAHRQMLANCFKTYLKLPEDKGSKEYLTMGANHEERVRYALTKPTWQTEIEERARAAGRKEGREEGMHAMLLTLLAQRFGALPPAVVRQVEAIASTAQLTRLGARLLIAGSLAELGLGDDGAERAP